jgi:hypothetical protein
LDHGFFPFFIPVIKPVVYSSYFVDNVGRNVQQFSLGDNRWPCRAVNFELWILSSSDVDSKNNQDLQIRDPFAECCVLPRANRNLHTAFPKPSVLCKRQLWHVDSLRLIEQSLNKAKLV